jgi:hypothetical protein
LIEGLRRERSRRRGWSVSLGLNISTIARIEADRIYALILPEEDHETVTVPLTFLSNVMTTGQNLEGFAPTYIRVALDRLTETAKISRFKRKAVIPKESLAFIAAAFRIAADSAEGRHP